MKRDAMIKGATISAGGQYRYALYRIWSPGLPILAVMMLNPSTADDKNDDPTITRVKGFARSHGFGGILVVNLFALRATEPEALYACADPVGYENNEYILTAARTHKKVLCGWGAHANRIMVADRVKRVTRMLMSPDPLNLGIKLYHLGLTKDGHPKHPLYLAAKTKMQLWQENKRRRMT